MRIKYNILLFEDSVSYADSLKTVLSSFLENLGFELILIRESDGKKCDELIRDKDIDLILIDLNLESGDYGNQVIAKIRKNESYKEIIFYSNDTKKFRKLIDKKLGPVEGVYFHVGRRNLPEKIKAIINLTLKKSQEVNNLRGLVIAETIDLEEKMEQIIIKYFDLTDIEKKEVFCERVLGPEFFTTSHKHNLVNRICKEKVASFNRQINGKLTKDQKKELETKRDNVQGLYDECIKIDEEVIKIRNVLSHVRESDTEKNTLRSTLKTYKTIKVTDDWCNQTRKNLRKHSKNLDKIFSHV